MRSLDQAHYVVMKSVGAIIDGLEPDNERDRINILRCILGVSAAELCKIIGEDGIQTELESLRVALDQVREKLRRGKLDA